MHLTNYSINKFNKHFIKNQEVEDGEIGHKRSIKSVFKKLES